MRNAARTLIGMAAAIFLLSGATSSLAQDANDDPVELAFDRDCMDDYGRDLCDPLKWGEIVASFDLEPAEQVQAQGWRGVRVFTINGYSRDMPMVSILYSDATQFGYPVDAVLEVRGTGGEGRAVPRLSRKAWGGLSLSAKALQGIISTSPQRQSDASAPEPVAMVDGVEEIVVCLHPWVTVTESLTTDGVERRVRNACGENPLFDKSYAFSAQALRGFPHCNHLEPGDYRNESSQLAGCLLLRGDDLFAAASLKNEKNDPPGFYGAENITREDWEAWMRTDGTARLDWAGTPYAEDPVSLADIMVQIGETLPNLIIYQSEFGSDEDGLGWVMGEVVYFHEDEEYHRTYWIADYEQYWTRREDGQWQMTNWTVGPFRELKPDDQ